MMKTMVDLFLWLQYFGKHRKTMVVPVKTIRKNSLGKPRDLFKAHAIHAMSHSSNELATAAAS